MTTRACRFLTLFTMALTLGEASAIRAQEPEPTPYKQVVSANPFGLLIELFNAEFERAISETSTAGFGGSTFSRGSERYINADVFFRYYPGVGAFQGWAFGGKLGITSVADATYFGYGFDVNHSWLLGRQKNFYVGLGFGLKRLVGMDKSAVDENGDELLDFIPTFRIINIGYAF